MIKVAIVEDKEETLRYLEVLLGGTKGLTVVGAYSTGKAALDGISRNMPDVALVDIGLPDMSGIDVIQALANRWPKLDIIVYSMYEDRKHLVAALKAGACGYILKGASAGEIIEAVEGISHGGSPMSPKIARFVIEELQLHAKRNADAELTPRETEVLKSIAQGKQEKTIAENLSLSPHTIHTYVKSIYKKLKVQSQTAAVLKARNKGII
jgi:DNA-binding NarL/FixJ family response regulator